MPANSTWHLIRGLKG